MWFLDLQAISGLPGKMPDHDLFFLFSLFMLLGWSLPIKIQVLIHNPGGGGVARPDFVYVVGYWSLLVGIGINNEKFNWDW